MLVREEAECDWQRRRQRDTHLTGSVAAVSVPHHFTQRVCELHCTSAKRWAANSGVHRCSGGWIMHANPDLFYTHWSPPHRWSTPSQRRHFCLPSLSNTAPFSGWSCIYAPGRSASSNERHRQREQSTGVLLSSSSSHMLQEKAQMV